MQTVEVTLRELKYFTEVFKGNLTEKKEPEMMMTWKERSPCDDDTE